MVHIPPQFAHYICKCGNDFRYRWDRHDSKIEGGWPYRCVNCNKFPAYDLFKCMSCDKDFYLDFRHPGFCRKFPTCWTCTSENAPNEPCFHYPPIVRELMMKNGVIEPVVFKPVKQVSLDEALEFDVPEFTID